MLLFYMLIIWKIQAVPLHQLTMYNTNNQRDGYCLLSYFLNPSFDDDNSMHIHTHQTISYCLRTSEEDNLIADLNLQNLNDPHFTFAELKEQNITSQMLLLWSNSIDQAEQYQIFLNSHSNSSFEKEVLFYNCTPPWFGSSCHFSLELEIDKSFHKTDDITFQSDVIVDIGTKVTCYEHLHCETLLSCLDWREICDRKVDCLDGSDENHCWQLEVNRCLHNEYRCHNGQCIPFEFYLDDINSPDCLDRTDEDPPSSYYIPKCYQIPNFNCEEHICRPENKEFSCGDGECTNGIDRCSNDRNSHLIDGFCTNLTACNLTSYSPMEFEWCTKSCLNSSCINDNCSTRYEFRSIPSLLAHVHFRFSSEFKPNELVLPDYVCYDESLCADFLPTTELIDNLTCRRFDDLGLRNNDSYADAYKFFENVRDRFRACLIAKNETFYCHYPAMYQCQNSSKCISKQRLLDGIHDCPFNDDEIFNESCSLTDVRQRFNCSVDDKKKCFASLIVRDGKPNCQDGADERDKKETWIKTHISFQTACDGKIELQRLLIDGRYETDETDCEAWPCNNTYSRCDGFWLCKNGADEVNCPSSTCSEHHHDCVFPNETSKVSCLPIAHAGDGIIDCFGASDEREKYHDVQSNVDSYYFRCWNYIEYVDIPNDKLCNNESDCEFNDDETFCTSFGSEFDTFCLDSNRITTDAEKHLCNLGYRISQKQIVYFKLSNIPIHPLLSTIDDTSIPHLTSNNTRPIQQNEAMDIVSDDAWLCNRGIPVRLRIDVNISKVYCLCPQNYYGNICQYQNQRVSLTLHVQIKFKFRSVFIFLITLIDHERNIHSHDHIQYVPDRDYIEKFNVYLLYSSRPKNLSKNYSVQIDLFYQWTLDYRASWIFPLLFPFLPVHRLPVSVQIPYFNVKPIHECRPPCRHGQCFSYFNDSKSMFCRCERGWAGIQCDMKQKCDCASDALCISDSICLCPPGRFGPRCHLTQLACHSEPCMNGGQCVPGDIRYTYPQEVEPICICSEEFDGDRCEHQLRRTQIDISFHPKLTIPSLVLIHFIEVQSEKEHKRTVAIKKNGFGRNSLVVYTSVWFNIAFVQMFSHYYLIILQEKNITLAHITTQIVPSHRCQSIDELFNVTFANQHLLRRIKYYHIPCRQYSGLVCFYDDIHFCLCTLDRTANCFEFEHNTSYDCDGYNKCENEGRCLQHGSDKRPKSSLCICRECYFGSICQFSTKGSTLSLDTILSNHIRVETKISQQPIIVKVAIVLTTIIFAFGFINSVLSFWTFREQETCNVGCGLYLFASSVISIIIVIILTLKLSFLLASQIGSINNSSFLNVQCLLFDFFLRSLRTTSDWLSACVAIERTVNVSKGIKFDKAKSKQVAKWMILIICLATSSTYSYDPIYRRRLLIDDEEQRTWCVSRYSSTLQIVDLVLHIFHFSVPFSINCISALIIIITTTRTRSNSQKTKSFKEHLCEQLGQHKHLLISPSALILLAIPRIIISFFSPCMRLDQNSWFYLIGYFISFIPSMMTFVVFVVPSEMYMKVFSDSMKDMWQR